MQSNHKSAVSPSLLLNVIEPVLKVLFCNLLLAHESCEPKSRENSPSWELIAHSSGDHHQPSDTDDDGDDD